jgi:protein ImuA
MPAQAFTKPSVPPACSPDRALLASLRAHIERIEGTAGVERMWEAWPLGVAAIDAVLPGGGLPRGCLHEIVAADVGGAAAAFAAVLLAGLAGDGGSVVWCCRDPGLHATKLYGPGLAAFGLDLRRLLVVRARRDVDVLWAMEEGLRSGAVSAVLGEVAAAPPIALRRLQLAAETGGTTGLLLRPFGAPVAAGSATTRWRVAAAPSAPLTPPLSRVREGEDPSLRPSPQGRWSRTIRVGKPLTLPLRGSLPLPRAEEGWGEGAHLLAVRWRVELLRCRAAAPAGWLLGWCHETHRLGVAAELRDRPVAWAATDPDRSAAV